MGGAFSRLLQSRKALLVFLDVFISVVSLIVSEFCAPETTKFVVALIVAVQPAFVTIINGIAKEDAAAKANGSFKGEFK